MSKNKLMVISVSVNNCARCSLNHDNIAFKKFIRHIDDFTYWAICPTTHEPILLNVVED